VIKGWRVRDPANAPLAEAHAEERLARHRQDTVRAAAVAILVVPTGVVLLVRLAPGVDRAGLTVGVIFGLAALPAVYLIRRRTLVRARRLNAAVVADAGNRAEAGLDIQRMPPAAPVVPPRVVGWLGAAIAVLTGARVVGPLAVDGAHGWLGAAASAMWGALLFISRREHPRGVAWAVVVLGVGLIWGVVDTTGVALPLGVLLTLLAVFATLIAAWVLAHTRAWRRAIRADREQLR
jgi:hypothetical protein